ncbi:C-terminal processing protease CtpA/Prc [Sphingomonas jejuensis]|uniref:C-terminal processing protease CtpA/Prc n=1 Tax=Sphingomonas jejuensis TaxID=904715 RepID=A0ABX0XN58_9SPHN|nr:S41 family peptidase [Sphingomonas jejuensis]NJC34818.1 C-terminal processing protease CtpA/Prc [Sphingomonas jejuensis]
MKARRFVALISVGALLSGCGGGGGGGNALVGTTPTPTQTSPTPSTPAPTATCSLRARQDWVTAQMREWYLFPETLPASLDPAAYATLSDYVDALTATARAQRRDRFFTYVTSIAEENAYYSSGQTAGFGVRLEYGTTSLTVLEGFENGPALAAGIDRGTVITGVGPVGGPVRTIADLYSSGGTQAIVDALGPSTAGTARVLAIRGTDGGTRQVTVTKADFELPAVSPRYGVRVIEQEGRRIGYINLRTFIDTAEQPLRNAFARFRAEGVTEIVFDLRYNGGGLVRVAELIGDLMARDRFSSDVFSYTTFRPEKSAQNSTRFFQQRSDSIAPTRVSFIGRGGTASASELVINAFIPYLGQNLALVGTNTYGKPVGQIALDRSACDDRLRVVAFATQNRDRQGDYYDGLASKVANSCAAADDASFPLGDPREASIARSIDFIAGRACTRIAGEGVQGQSARIEREQLLLSPDRPTTAQREVPGLF